MSPDVDEAEQITMPTVAIPAWNKLGLLPPINEAEPTSFERSPYCVTLPDFVVRFGTSPERRRILKGFLEFRVALHRLGISNGFQWLDGSFVEHVERTRRRPPQDLDLVTFFHVPAGSTQRQLLADGENVFVPRNSKATYCVDAYFVDLTANDVCEVITRATYWYGLYSHWNVDKIPYDCERSWKGLIQVDLEPSQDAAAQRILDDLA